ncbi:MAG: hypothetical protein H0T71_16025 [Acidobacteria bacterium]|nr:hypothetical protein [Acidobacteriota bacterium]
MTPRIWLGTMAVLAALVAHPACTGPRARPDGAPKAAASPGQRSAPALDHIAPPRDMTGTAPKYFEWTPVEGADHYAIGVWNDIDSVVWRNDDVRTNSVDWPKELTLDFGTYFWAVTALRGDVPIVHSGRSVFMILR